MLKEFSVNFHNLLLSLSDAIDLANPSIASHQMRTAFITWQLSNAAGLPKERVEKLFIASLFHDIGAMSLEEKLEVHNSSIIDEEHHCILSEEIFNLSHLFEPSKNIVRHHHKPWHLWDASIQDPDVFDTQLLYLADQIEKNIDRSQYILHQVDRIGEMIENAAGDCIHSDIVKLFHEISHREDFWLDLVSPRLYSILLHAGPFQKMTIGYDNIYSVAHLFKHTIDFKSRFTATHSTGVAECAVMISKIFGLTDFEIMQMKIAGYFHDIGKLTIPNSILEKNGKLTKEEFAIIRQHTYFTYSVLKTIGGLDHIAEWAAFHHEKLDGTGYPFHVGAENLSIFARIMAVSDIFTAISEDRPYRVGMKRSQIEKILISQVENNALEKKIVHLLLDNFEEISSYVKEKQHLSRDVYDMKFSKVNFQNRSGQGRWEPAFITS
ncbi:MAG: HD domain-containing phosphohydrolase [Desulfobacteraceae bacterium]|jgi:HD-GYP domain-containing protein (c-di-GMP phosphodiesterase class II)